MSQVVAPLLSKIIARFLLNAENSGWRLGLCAALPAKGSVGSDGSRLVLVKVYLSPITPIQHQLTPTTTDRHRRFPTANPTNLTRTRQHGLPAMKATVMVARSSTAATCTATGAPLLGGKRVHAAVLAIAAVHACEVTTRHAKHCDHGLCQLLVRLVVSG